MDSLISNLSNIKFLFGASLMVLIGTFAYVMYAVSTNEKVSYSFTDMLVEDGKASITRFSQFVALMISSWGFIALVMVDKLTEAYFGLYMAAWVLNRGVTKYLEKNSEPEQKAPVCKDKTTK